MELLTGKCREAFEKWVFATKEELDFLFDIMGIEALVTPKINALEELPFSMQWGVYLEFFDSIGIYINVFYVFGYNEDNFNYEISLKSDELYSVNQDDDHNIYTREEAQTKAIKKANSIFNEI